MGNLGDRWVLIFVLVDVHVAGGEDEGPGGDFGYHLAEAGDVELAPGVPPVVDDDHFGRSIVGVEGVAVGGDVGREVRRSNAIHSVGSKGNGHLEVGPVGV